MKEIRRHDVCNSVLLALVFVGGLHIYGLLHEEEIDLYWMSWVISYISLAAVVFCLVWMVNKKDTPVYVEKIASFSSSVLLFIVMTYAFFLDGYTGPYLLTDGSRIVEEVPKGRNSVTIKGAKLKGYTIVPLDQFVECGKEVDGQLAQDVRVYLRAVPTRDVFSFYHTAMQEYETPDKLCRKILFDFVSDKERAVQDAAQGESGPLARRKKISELVQEYFESRLEKNTHGGVAFRTALVTPK